MRVHRLLVLGVVAAGTAISLSGAGASGSKPVRYSPIFAVLEGGNEIGNSGRANVGVIQGDAAALPFPDSTFSSVLAILLLHHLQSPELQDRAFSESARVLRPGGVFLAFDIPNAWIHRVAHIQSTFVPLELATASKRLTAAGLSHITMDSRSGGFRIRALRVA